MPAKKFRQKSIGSNIQAIAEVPDENMEHTTNSLRQKIRNINKRNAL